MKITIVLGPFHPLPPAGIGAVEKVWWALSQRFAQAGHQVTVIGKGDAEATRRSMPGVTFTPLNGHTASRRIVGSLLSDLRYAFRVCRHLEPSDIVVTNSFWTPVLLGLLRRSAARNVIVNVNRFPKGQMWLYRRARILQAVSTVVADEVIRQEPALRDKVRMLPNPVDVETYRPPTTARRYDGEFTVLYVGRLHPEKGLDLLVDACRLVSAKARHVRFRLVGPASIAQGGGGEDWVRALRAKAEGLPIEFVDPIRDPAELAREFQRAHCFCYPSLADKGEALPVAVLEAMACGLGAVVSDLSCFRDYLDHGKEGLVFDHRGTNAADNLAKSLLEMASDPMLARRLGENAATRAQGYSLGNVATRYLELFESQAGRP